MSIEFIIKRDGTKEPFQPKKLNGWGEWAAEYLENYVDWSEVVLHCYSTSQKEITSEQLQNSLIDYCLTKASFAYNRMAGKLFAALLYKQIYNSSSPFTIKEVHSKLVAVNLMSSEFYDAYSEEDYAELEKIINHNTAAGLFMGTAALAGGIFNAACMTW